MACYTTVKKNIRLGGHLIEVRIIKGIEARFGKIRTQERAIAKIIRRRGLKHGEN